jgi:hypothetical protein
MDASLDFLYIGCARQLPRGFSVDHVNSFWVLLKGILPEIIIANGPHTPPGTPRKTVGCRWSGCDWVIWAESGKMILELFQV